MFEYCSTEFNSKSKQDDQDKPCSEDYDDVVDSFYKCWSKIKELNFVEYLQLRSQFISRENSEAGQDIDKRFLIARQKYEALKNATDIDQSFRAFQRLRRRQQGRFRSQKLDNETFEQRKARLERNKQLRSEYRQRLEDLGEERAI